MRCTGSCSCEQVKLSVIADVVEGELKPRICDCDYCLRNPSSVISHPTMVVRFNKKIENLSSEQNGDRLANFYRCPNCNSFLFVAAVIDGVVRGAVNSALLACEQPFGEYFPISPKMLSAEEKIERWNTLWGTIVENADAFSN